MTFLNKYKLVFSLTIAVILLILSNLHTCNSLQVADKKLNVSTQNVQVLQDSLRISIANNGEKEANKLAFLTDKVSNLEKLSQDLAKEVRNTQGKVSTIIQGGVQIVHDTIPLIVDSKILDSSVVSTFNFDKKYSNGNSRDLQGFTKYNLRTGQSEGLLTKDSIKLSFVTGIKNLDKGKPEIFLRSDYPGFQVVSLDGAVLDPKLFTPKNKQKLLTLGVSIGYIPVTYDIISKKLDFSISRLGVSAGVNINLTKLLK